MARIRSVKPKFWDDIKLSKVSRDTRLLFIGMWNFADDLGVIISDPIWLKSKIFPYDKLEPNQLESWLSSLTHHQFILEINYNNENFYFIRTFDKHQRINKPNSDDIFIPKHSLSIILDKLRNNHGTITEQSRKGQVAIAGGEDRIGIGKDRIGEDGNSPTNPGIDSSVFFDAEKEVLGNQIQFERICTAGGKNAEDAKESLRKFHLHLEANDRYPQTRKQIFAGFEKWVLNEKKYYKNGTAAHQQISGNNSDKPGTSEARITKAKNR